MFANAYYLDDDCPESIKDCIRLFEENFFRLFPAWLKGKFWIAGGAMRSYFLDETPRDIDIYCVDSQIRDRVIACLVAKGATLLDSSPISQIYVLEGVSYDLPLRTFSNPEHTIFSFDLNICMCATDGEVLYCTYNYFIDLATKTLSVHSIDSGKKTLQRVMRYGNKGFTLPNKEIDRLYGAIRNEYIEEDSEDTVPVAVDPNAQVASSMNSSTYKQKPSFSAVFKGLRVAASKDVV
jgi:hypothetical protein